MSYQPIRTRFSSRSQQAVTSLMGKKGLDYRDLPQLLSPDYAITLKNYYVTSDGGLVKRKGMSLLFDRSVTNGITMIEKFTDRYILIGHTTKFEAWDLVSASATTIKTFTSSGTFSGQRVGDYFFVTNGTEALGRLSLTLNYDAQTANFTAGKVLTGATSGATAVILQDADGGATGTLTLGSIVGTFQNNEIITDNNGTPGSATVDGVLNFTYTTVSGAPTCSFIKSIGARLYAAVLDSVRYSATDDGTNPPFTTWTTGTNANDPGIVTFRNAGTVRNIEGLGDNIVVFADNGKWAFKTTTIDSSGTLKKIDQTIVNRIDLGSGRATLNTDKGIFYANEAGLWQLVSIGQPNIPYSDQEGVASKLLGTTYFDDVNLTNADLAYLPQYNLLMLSCGKDSATNNQIIVYNVETKAFSLFSGWNINRFLNNNQTLYGAGATTAKVWTLFDGNSDDGNDIWTEFEQEIRLGSLNTRQSINKFWVQGLMSPSSDVTVRFNIYDKQGNYVANKTTWQWTPQGNNSGSGGFGVSAWGTATFGGSEPSGKMVESFDGCAVRINNFQRLRVKFTEHSKVPLQINWFSLEGRVKAPIRVRHINQLT